MCITIEKVGNLTKNAINSAQKVRNCLKSMQEVFILISGNDCIRNIHT